MSTPRYRIGNDLTVLWAINNKDGSPYDLSQKEVRLFVTHPRDRIEVEATIQTLQGGVINNVIRWDFSGLDQRVLGKYRLTAEIYTSSNKKLIRKDITEAFELVSRSEMENDEGGEEIMDGGDLYLSSTLDIYRFGIPKVKIGTDGFWYIDNVKTTVSALGGGPGLVKNIYTENDFDKTYDANSVIDTFNAHAVASLEKRIKFLEGDFYTQVSNLTDVLFGTKPQTGQALVWNGTYWTAKDVATKGESGGGLSDKELKIFKDLQKLLDWFSLDEDNNMIRANHGLYSFGPLVAGGTIQGLQPSAANRLEKLRDVQITDVEGGQSLVYNEDLGKWINDTVEGGEGSAKLEQDISVDIPVGNIKAGITLQGGLSLTEILIMMFSQSISNVPPLVKLSNVPEQCEVGTVVHINPSYKYTDGRYKNTHKGEVEAGCKEQGHIFKLDGVKMEAVPADLPTKDAKQHSVSVEVSYGDSEASVITASGEEYDNKIKAGTVKDEKTFIVGYRAFWGYMTDDEAENLTSELVRGLEHRDTIIDPTKGKISLLQGDDTVPAGQDIMIVIPSSYILSEVVDKNDINFAENFALSPITVRCAGDVEASYNVYRFDNQSAYPMDIKKITIEEA